MCLCGISQAHVSKLSLQPSMIGNYAAILIKLFITPEYVCSHQEQEEKTLMSLQNFWKMYSGET